MSCGLLQVFKELGRLKRILASMKDTTFQSSGKLGSQFTSPHAPTHMHTHITSLNSPPPLIFHPYTHMDP